jgi:hypothetical protein
MTKSMISISGERGPRRVGVAVEQACAIDVEPSVKAQMLRTLAAWYRALAARAANPVIWESRLFTADHLDAEASRIDPQHDNRETKL